jgi:membrane protease YdiL (CAAX protease family)
MLKLLYQRGIWFRLNEKRSSALMTFVPMIAALILVYWKGGVGGAAALLKRTLDSRKPNNVGWVLATLLFMPTICILEFGVLRFENIALPVPQTSFGEAAFLFLAFFIGAIGEELGWQGFAYPYLRASYAASFVLA